MNMMTILTVTQKSNMTALSSLGLSNPPGEYLAPSLKFMCLIVLDISGNEMMRFLASVAAKSKMAT